MTRRVIAGMIVVGLGAGIWLLWPRADSPGPTSTTQPIAVGTTSTSSDSSVSTTPNPSSSSTTSATRVVETVEEAEAILRELWFGWFEGIYNQDEDRIREVVATEEFAQAGISAFGTLHFTAYPTGNDISFADTELLMATSDCLVIWTTGTARFLNGTPQNTGVDVLRRVDDEWKTFSTWQFKGDLWESDCDALLESS